MDKLVIFDMDGTLIDSIVALTNSVNFVRNSIGLDSIDVNLVAKEINNPYINLPLMFYGTQNYLPEHKKLFMEHYNEECINNIILYDGIMEILDNGKDKIMFSIATNADDIFAKKMVKKLKIDHFFEYIIGANLVSQPKPHPHMIEKTVEKLNFKKENVILVGDSKKDQISAKEANIDFIFASWGYGEAIMPVKIAKDPFELEKMLY